MTASGAERGQDFGLLLTVTDLRRVARARHLTRWYDEHCMDAEWTAGGHMAQYSTQPILMGHAPGTEESPQDKRFKHPDWTESVVFNFFKESYLIWTKAVLAGGARRQGARPGDRAQGRLLYAPVRRRALPIVNGGSLTA